MKRVGWVLAVLVLLALGVGACSGRATVAPAQPEGAIAWGTDFARAMEVAKASGRPVLVDFSGSDWCGWCIKLDEEVFSQPEFVRYATNAFVMFQADFPQRKAVPEATKRQNEELAAQYGVEGFPTVLILAPDGKVLARTGYQPGGPAAYVAYLKNVVAQGKQ